jgi:hypothetical protein
VGRHVTEGPHPARGTVGVEGGEGLATMSVDVHVLSAESTREDVEEALGHVLREIRRAPRVVARGGCPPSRFENLHHFADELLTLWEAAAE